jgi:hypothetical protein
MADHCLNLPAGTNVSLPSDVRWQEFGLAILNGLDPPFPIDIQFEELPEYSELARIVDSTVWLNRSQPAYQRALMSCG